MNILQFKRYVVLSAQYRNADYDIGAVNKLLQIFFLYNSTTFWAVSTTIDRCISKRHNDTTLHYLKQHGDLCIIGLKNKKSKCAVWYFGFQCTE